MHRNLQVQKIRQQQGIKLRNLMSTKVTGRSSLRCSCLSDKESQRRSELHSKGFSWSVRRFQCTKSNRVEWTHQLCWIDIVKIEISVSRLWTRPVALGVNTSEIDRHSDSQEELLKFRMYFIFCLQVFRFFLVCQFSYPFGICLLSIMYRNM